MSQETATPEAPVISVEEAILSKLDAEEALPEKVESKEAPEPEAPTQEAETIPEPEPEEKTESPKYKVKVRGEEVEVPLEELLNGYSRTQDYKAKTAETAEQRRQAQAELEAAKAERQRYAQSLDQALHIANNFDPIISEGNKTDWAKLAQENPTEYVQKWATYQQRIERFGSLVKEQQAIREAQSKEFLRQEEDRLISKLPEWGNEDGKKKIAQTVSDYLANNGFTKQEIGQLADHRMMLVVLDAAKYREVEKAKKAIPEKKAVPEPPRVQKPTNGEAKSNTNAKRVAQLKEIARTGRIDDQVNAILQLTE